MRLLVSLCAGSLLGLVFFGLSREYYSVPRSVLHWRQSDGPYVFPVVMRAGDEYRLAVLADESRTLRRYYVSSDSTAEERSNLEAQLLGGTPVLTRVEPEQLWVPLADVSSAETAINKNTPEIFKRNFFDRDVRFDISVEPLEDAAQQIQVTAHWASDSWCYKYRYSVTPNGYTSVRYGMKSFATLCWSLPAAGTAFGVGFVSSLLCMRMRKARKEGPTLRDT